MWLLDTSTYRLVFVQDPSQARYAILSHVWDTAGEQTFQDVQAIHISARAGFQDGPIADTDPRLLDSIRSLLSAKITRCCDYARAKGYALLWIDSCCIDKTSSAELSEAINSMYTWYAKAKTCYVFLADVETADNPKERDSSFRGSMWFQRGWTLQELIVPSRNVFLSKDWRMIGTKTTLADVIGEITAIDKDILLHTRQLYTVSVAQRMAWASGRKTTRVEDEAYCLMGIFGVRLPVIYGEGSQAFVRLQEEIMRRVPDQSLFLWGIERDILRVPHDSDPWPELVCVSNERLRASKSAYLFATCPMDFHRSQGFSPIPLGTFSTILGLPKASCPPLYTPSGYGVHLTLPISTLLYRSGVEMKVAVLACRSTCGRIPALLLSTETSSSQHLIGGFYFHHQRIHEFDLTPGLGIIWADANLQPPPRPKYSMSYPRVILLDPSILTDTNSVASPALCDICIPQQRMSAVSDLIVFGRQVPKPETRQSFQGDYRITLPCWSLEHLNTLGYSANVTIENGEMVPILLGSMRRNAFAPRSHGPAPADHLALELTHPVRGTMTVAIFTCPVAPLLHYDPSAPALHATVTWGLGSEHDIQLVAHDKHKHTGAEPDACTQEHINLGADARKRFQGPANASAVWLHLSAWDDDTGESGSWPPGTFGPFDSPCYALDVRFEPPASRSMQSVAPPPVVYPVDRAGSHLSGDVRRWSPPSSEARIWPGTYHVPTNRRPGSDAGTNISASRQPLDALDVEGTTSTAPRNYTVDASSAVLRSGPFSRLPLPPLDGPGRSSATEVSDAANQPVQSQAAPGDREHTGSSQAQRDSEDDGGSARTKRKGERKALNDSSDEIPVTRRKRTGRRLCWRLLGRKWLGGETSDFAAE